MACLAEAAAAGAEEESQREVAILSLFSAWDTNGDGVIDPPELTAVLQAMGLDEQAIAILFDAADTSKDGRIDYQEFVRWVYSDIVPEEVSDMVPKAAPSLPWDAAAVEALKNDDGRALRLALLQEGADLTATVRIEAVANVGEGYLGEGHLVYFGDQLIYELHLDENTGEPVVCDHIFPEEPSVSKYGAADDIVDLIVKNRRWDCRQALMTSGLLPFQRRTQLKFGPAAVDALIADDGPALLRACSLPDADVQMEVYIGFRIERYEAAGDEDYHWVNFGEKCIYAFDTYNNGGFEREWSARDYISTDVEIIRPNINKYEPCDDLVSLVVKNKRQNCAQALLASGFVSETQRARLLSDQAAMHPKEATDGFNWDGEWNMTWVSGDYAGKTSTVKVEEGRVGTPVHAAHGSGFDFDQYPLEKEKSPVRFVWKDGTVQAVKDITRNKVVWSTTRPDQPCIVWERNAADEPAP